MRGLKFFVVREKLYRRSFKCLARSRQHSCLFVCFFLQCYGLFKAACLVSMAHFPWFCWQYFSLITTFLIHSTRTRTFYCVRDSGIFFTCPIVVSPAKPNRCLLKTTDIFSASYALLWLALYGFFCFFSANQELICTVLQICSCIKGELHSFFSQSELSNCLRALLNASKLKRGVGGGGVLALPGVFLNSGFKMASKIERKEKVIACSWNDIKGKFTQQETVALFLQRTSIKNFEKRKMLSRDFL